MRFFQIFLAGLIICAPVTLAAQEVVSPQEFEAYAGGKTLYFSQHGQPYGAEQYLPGQKSIWQYSDGSCTHGVWFAEKARICFIYEGQSVPQCWKFLKKPEGFAARAEGAKARDDLKIIGRDTRPISCKGPNVGV